MLRDLLLSKPSGNTRVLRRWLVVSRIAVIRPPVRSRTAPNGSSLSFIIRSIALKVNTLISYKPDRVFLRSLVSLFIVKNPTLGGAWDSQCRPLDHFAGR